MAGIILTPNLLWKDFVVETDFNETEVIINKEDRYTVREFYFNGRACGKGRVSIFARAIKRAQKKSSQAILYVRDLGAPSDEAMIKALADDGYLVLDVDIEGETINKEHYTKYPEEISYANYAISKDNLFGVLNDARSTCWYEWAAVLRYALAYLKNIDGIEKVGGFAVGDSATALWQVAGMDEKLDCAVFGLNAGWAGYRGTDKFGGKVEPQFSDDIVKFIAGIEPQAYAMHVTCPTLILAATNSNVYDCDRVYDTISHIPQEIYAAVNYSVGYVNSVDKAAILSTKVFFGKNLLGNVQEELSNKIDIKCDLADGAIVFTVEAGEEQLKELCVFVCEQTTKPSLRCWRKVTIHEKNAETGECIFKYFPYSNAQNVVAFAQASYKNGYEIGSKTIMKKFSEQEVSLTYKSNVIYSSRNANAESVFVPAKQDGKGEAHLNYQEVDEVFVKKGPMGINGVYAKNGLLTFKINSDTDRPSDEAILMFDVYSKESSAMAVKLIANYFGEKMEYFGWVTLHGGEVWQNVKIEKIRFKTEQGLGLKSYQKIEAIEFVANENGYLLNNALWV